MEIKSKFDHFNINVLDLDRSIAFYNKALGLKEHHRKEAQDGSFVLVYLTDDQTGFLLELTWLKDRNAPYELGDNESHLCFRVAGDYDEVRKFHKKWTAYVMRIRLWGYISSTIPTITGSRFCQPDKRQHTNHLAPKLYQPFTGNTILVNRSSYVCSFFL